MPSSASPAPVRPARRQEISRVDDALLRIPPALVQDADTDRREERGCREFTSARLIEDFGSAAPASLALRRALCAGLEEALAPGGRTAVRGMYEEWCALFAQTTADGLQRASKRDDPEHLRRELFVLHTTHAVLLQVLAAEILSRYGPGSRKSFLDAALSCRTAEDLRRFFRRELAGGAFFERVHVPALGEPSVFGWHVRITDFSAVAQALRGILERLLLYRLDAESLHHCRRDVLRDLFQNLVPARLRKTLGEFYTPDWLADFCLDSLEHDDGKWLTRRVLDPTCGSGAFLLAAVRRKLDAAGRAGLDAVETLRMLEATIMGIDLSPLAVLSARVNFLLGISELLPELAGQTIRLPVQQDDAACPTSPGPETFDAVLGNPPWVRWSALPPSYRERVRETCVRYRIFSEHGYHGGNELDLSAVITYSAADKWLAAGGRLVFVIPQTLMQSPSGSGFRRFRLPDGSVLQPLRVDDLSSLRPFPDATTRTAVLQLEKRVDASSVQFPVPYVQWTSDRRSVLPDSALEAVLADVRHEFLEAIPAQEDAPGSPWAVLPPGAASAARRYLHPCTTTQGRKGITADVNGVYFVDCLRCSPDRRLLELRNRPQEGRTDIGPDRRFWCEAEAVYPLLKGAADIAPCRLRVQEPARCVIVPNRGIDRARLEEAENDVHPAGRFPRLHGYLRVFEEVLRRRSTWRLRMKGAPFFALYNVGDYTFAPWKVVWPEVSPRFAAAVAGSFPVAGEPRVWVPDHKLFFVEFSEPEPAHFFCALLNSPSIVRLVDSFRVKTSTGNLLRHLSLPEYDAGRRDHREIEELCRRVHEAPEEQYPELLEQLRRMTETLLLG